MYVTIYHKKVTGRVVVTEESLSRKEFNCASSSVSVRASRSTESSPCKASFYSETIFGRKRD